jgi:hypothetical protein
MDNCHPRTELPKVEFLEQLYRAAGRDRKSHPDHGLYTGLYKEWCSLQQRAADLNEEPAH